MMFFVSIRIGISILYRYYNIIISFCWIDKRSTHRFKCTCIYVIL